MSFVLLLIETPFSQNILLNINFSWTAFLGQGVPQTPLRFYGKVFWKLQGSSFHSIYNVLCSCKVLRSILLDWHNATKILCKSWYVIDIANSNWNLWKYCGIYQYSEFSYHTIQTIFVKSLLFSNKSHKISKIVQLDLNIPWIGKIFHWQFSIQNTYLKYNKLYNAS